MAEANWQNFSPVQSNQQPFPPTIIAAVTIAPANNAFIITGTTAVATITPPLKGQHELIIISATSNWAGMLTTGNIIAASITNSVLWANKVTRLWFNPINQKYYPTYGTIA